MGSDYPASKFIKPVMKSVDKINAESNWVVPIFLQCLRYNWLPFHISPPAATAHRCPKPNPLICLHNPTGKALRNTATCFLRPLCRDGVWWTLWWHTFQPVLIAPSSRHTAFCPMCCTTCPVLQYDLTHILYTVITPLVLSILSWVYFGFNHDAEGYLPWECPPSVPSSPLLEQLLSNLPVLFLSSFWGHSDTIYHPINKAATANGRGCAVWIQNEDELHEAKCRLDKGKK